MGPNRKAEPAYIADNGVNHQCQAWALRSGPGIERRIVTLSSAPDLLNDEVRRPPVTREVGETGHPSRGWDATGPQGLAIRCLPAAALTLATERLERHPARLGTIVVADLNHRSGMGKDRHNPIE